MRQFKPLTSLRAFLALWVLCRHWFHVYGADPMFIDIGSGNTFFDHGYLGVDGFFMLSGFILTYNYGSSNGRRLDKRKFIVARIARIYPVHIACLVLFAVCALTRDFALHTHAVGSPDLSASGFILSALLLSAWRYAGSNGWNDVAWSVSAEWFAYVCFPLFLLAAPRLNKVRIFAVAGLAMAGLVAVELTSNEHLAEAGGLARLIPEFLLGVLLLRLREAMPNFGGFVGGSLVSLLVCALGIKIGADSLFVAGAACLILALSYERDALTRALSCAPLVFLGEISYCIYLVQRIPQYLFAFARSKLPWLAAMPAPMQALQLLLLTLVAAVLLHYLVENPMRSFINRRFGVRKDGGKSLATSSS
jgi:peptidoglycan/LPS O-acetylase OafA/YrhL